MGIAKIAGSITDLYNIPERFPIDQYTFRINRQLTSILKRGPYIDYHIHCLDMNTIQPFIIFKNKYCILVFVKPGNFIAWVYCYVRIEESFQKGLVRNGNYLICRKGNLLICIGYI